MRNVETRLSRLEQMAPDDGGSLSWDWANDPYYLEMTGEKKAQIHVIMDKIRPHLPHNPTAAMETLSYEQLEELEKIYIAHFGTEALNDAVQS